MAQEVFRRVEIKYLLSAAEFTALLQKISPFIEKDKYFEATNCSVYYDTDNDYLAIHSMEKPLYKEKIRVRSYNVPKSLDDPVFVEIKKKYKGIGSKRRVLTTLREFYHYEKTGELKNANPQIKAELDQCFSFYHLKPALYVAYDRNSYCGKNDNGFRITFDRNVRSRTTDLRLECGDSGEKYFKDGKIVMEVKALDAYPLWFARALSELRIYPASFSKYGRIVEKRLKNSSPATAHRLSDYILDDEITAKNVILNQALA